MSCRGRFSRVNTLSFVPANPLMSTTYIHLKPSNLPIMENTYYLAIKPLKAEPKIGVLRISGDNTWEAYVNFQSTRHRRPSRFSNASDSRGPHEPDS
jgi:hypothetical protein